ncbi:hypothetical protein [Endozoicomonas sp. 8E]|uniref:hypothetical protein n=1 Tax=Endozoicomonas sp. 8E TaxID=3035692 RepID=UPI002938CFD2|nr:hypothetical protein [Endozoicomonas sp. 8E]WOG30124.1 hypothetical protein P6910_10855 [Endozoicomonas sp. 8E]
MSYSIEEHKHRFAAWAAGRAATVNGCRFKVEDGKRILESSGMNEVAKSIDNLPSANEFDKAHREWREKVINSAKELNLNFTHGVAAKLINIYLKSVYVCGDNHNDSKVKAIHPPIDSVLLDDLYKQDIGSQKSEWQKARKARWSKLTSNEYESVIAAVKKSVPANCGLWQIEEYWQGFQ